MSDITWSTLYTDHADVYEILVSHEDYQNNLIGAIQHIQPLDGNLAAEFGVGTGRITKLLAGRVRCLHAFDLSRSMLRVAQGKLRREHWGHISLAQADSRCMPVRSDWADFAIEGWAFLQIAVDHPEDWPFHLGRALDEMQRIVHPGGKMILIETLGTGESAPRVAPFHREVYDFLEAEHDFTTLDLRTDYCFETREQVQQVVVPLFGPEMLERLVHTGDSWVLPECTGIWWREVRSTN